MGSQRCGYLPYSIGTGYSRIGRLRHHRVRQRALPVELYRRERGKIEPHQRARQPGQVRLYLSDDAHRVRLQISRKVSRQAGRHRGRRRAGTGLGRVRAADATAVGGAGQAEEDGVGDLSNAPRLGWSTRMSFGAGSTGRIRERRNA
uniref:(northern house mosquito) hypothetical protein n=1 Tax=Culex pipiens TaxID=7175 RepID=A0A8D8HBV8_CULPI